MMSPRERKKIEKRKRIMEGAIRVFAENGFHGTTVAQVAAEAGVADGTIYLYFENKDDLLVSIFEETMDHFIDTGIETIAGCPSPVDKLRAIARLHLENLGANEYLASVFQIELRYSLHIMKKFSQSKLRRYFSIIEQVIREGQQTGHFRRDFNPWIAVKVLFGALDEMATDWLLRTKDADLVQMADPTLDILVRGLAADRV